MSHDRAMETGSCRSTRRGWIPAAWLLALALTVPAAGGAHEALEDTVEALDATIAVVPTADAYVRRATANRLLGNYDAALDDLAAAEWLDSSNAAVWLERAEVWASSGAVERALEAADVFVALTGGSLRAFHLRAVLNEELGRFGDALADCAAADALQPNIDIMLLEGRLLGRESGPAASASFMRTAWEQTGSTALLVAAFDAALAAADHASALELADAGLASARVPTRWLLRRAAVLRADGRESEAMDTLATAADAAGDALARRPSCANRLDRARVSAALGELDSAAEDARAVLALCGEDRNARRAALLLLERSP